MRKLKLILSTIFLTIACVCMASGGVSYARVVRATIDDSAGIDLGKYNTETTQETTEEYSSLGSRALYYSDDSDATEALYTVRSTNLSSIDVGSSTGYSSSFGSSIKIQMLASSDSSNRLPWLSHSFKLADNLYQASVNGYLSVSVNATSSINTSKDELKSVLYNGTLTSVADITSYAYDIESIYKSTTAVNQTLSLSNAQYSDYLLVFAMNRIDGGAFSWRTIYLNIDNPTLSITSSDTTYPSVSFDIDNNWSATEKTLTITVTDNESGVYSATSSSEVTLKSESSDDKVKVYTMKISDNGSYPITVTDNVGNSYTYTYTESKMDKTPANAVSLSMPEVSYVTSIDVTASLVSDGYSPETIYYTLDGSTPTTASNILNSGVNTISELEYGEYVLTAVAIDEVGNVGTITTKNFKIDRRTIEINAIKCDVIVTKPTTLESDIGYQCYDNERIRLDFTAHDNCLRRVIRIDSTEYELDNDYFEFVATGDTVVEVIYVTRLILASCNTVYTYDPDITEVTPIFSLNIDNLNLDIEITKDGVVTTPKNVGVYTLTWSYVDYEYAGTGSFDFEIKPLDIYILALEDQYKIYGEADCEEFAYEVVGLPENESIEVVLGREAGENVGAYAMTLESVIVSENFKVNFETQNYLIRTRKLVVIADSLNKQFETEDPELTYSFYETSLINGDVLTGKLERTAGESVGNYVIGKGTLANANYDILFLSGILTITPRDIVISIDDIVTTYGDEKELTFSTEEGVNLDSFTGALSRTEGNKIGVYTINIGTLSSTDYNITVAKSGTYTINPKTIIVRALPTEKVYGEKDNLMYEVDGLIDGDILNGSLNRNLGEVVGQYEINLGTLNNDNYIINFESNYLTITPAGLTINIASLSQVYGEMDIDFEYSIDGIKFDDEVIIELYRQVGDNVGNYVISCKDITNPNYTIAELNTGIYSITKATIVPVIKETSFVYSGKVNYVSVNNFPFELTYIYKQNGIECDGMLNAGAYQVQAIFSGNENYKESKSATVNIVVNRQQVYITLADNKFIYDGTVKFPEFYYDTTCGLDINKLSFEFENDIRPIEVGEYNFRIVNTDENYEVNASGVIQIAEALNIKNNNDSVIECEDATFDSNSQGLVLIEEKVDGKFNDQKIISTCKFDNVEEDDNHIYTVRVKATSDAENVYVYQLGENNSIREIVVNNVDGYYVFKVDNLTDTYIITRDIEPLPFWFWLIMIGGIVTALVVTLQIIKHYKKIKLLKNNSSSMDTYNIN